MKKYLVFAVFAVSCILFAGCKPDEPEVENITTTQNDRSDLHAYLYLSNEVHEDVHCHVAVEVNKKEIFNSEFDTPLLAMIPNEYVNKPVKLTIKVEKKVYKNGEWDINNTRHTFEDFVFAPGVVYYAEYWQGDFERGIIKFENADEI